MGHRRVGNYRGKHILAGLALLGLLFSALPAWGEPGVAVEIRVKEILQANPPVSAWVDSNTTYLPVGLEVHSLQGNFGLNLLVKAIDSQTVDLQYRLATLGTNVQHRSSVVNVEFDIPIVIDSIPGKGKSYYRALLTPRRAEVERPCLESLGDPTSWPYDPSAHFEIHFVKNSLADAHWNILRDFLEREYKSVHKLFGFDFPGQVHFYLCPCEVENFTFEPELKFALDPGRLAGYVLYYKGTNSVDPQITNLLKFYRWWGFAPRFLAWGVSGHTDFVDFYAKRYAQDQTLIPLESLLVSLDYRRADPLKAYFQSASFVHFLIDSIGVNAFRDLYMRSTDLSIKPAFLAVTGKTIDEWESLWKKFLKEREFRYPELIYHAHRAKAILREDEHLQYLELALADLGDSLSISLIQELAVTYYGHGRYADSYEWYKKIVAAEPENANYQQYCGNIAAVLGRLDEAWVYFSRAIELDTAYGAPFLSMGEIMDLRRYPDSAASLWETGLRCGESIPIYTELLIRLGRRDRRHYRTGEAFERLAMARNATARLLGEYPDHPRYLLRMGDILTELNKLDSAIVYYEAAEFFEYRPFYLTKIYLGMGRAYDLAGKRKKAVEYYERIFDTTPGYATRRKAEKYINEIYR